MQIKINKGKDSKYVKAKYVSDFFFIYDTEDQGMHRHIGEYKYSLIHLPTGLRLRTVNNINL